jgi:hypothetical protein
MVTRVFFRVVGGDRAPESVADVGIGEDVIIAECASLCLDGVAGCTCMCMSDLWVAVEAETSECSTPRRGRGE